MSANALKKIDKQLEGLDPDSLRYRVLISLRKFRSSWVELGQLLTDVAFGGDYKDWGYEEFELYCARELGLKKPTVKKLMVSYNYMKSHEPKRLEKGTDENGYDVPDYQTVELLHRMRNNPEVDEGEATRIHEQAFSGESDEGHLRKEIRDHMTSMSSEEMDAAGATRKRELGDILRTARALRRKLAHSKAVPDGLKDRLEQLLVELESLD